MNRVPIQARVPVICPACSLDVLVLAVDIEPAEDLPAVELLGQVVHPANTAQVLGVLLTCNHHFPIEDWDLITPVAGGRSFLRQRLPGIELVQPLTMPHHCALTQKERRMRFTAKLKVGSKFPNGTRTTALTFGPNYGAHGAEVNREWAEATPGLHLQMTVKNELADTVELGDEFTVTFERDELTTETEPE